MSQVRVIGTIDFPNREMADGALAPLLELFGPKAQEAGALQYELFRSQTNPCRLVLLEHWASRPLYDQHWLTQMQREGVPQLPAEVKVKLEFYTHAEYVLLDEIWQPADPELRLQTVRWA